MATAVFGIIKPQLRVNFEADQNGRRIGTVAATEDRRIVHFDHGSCAKITMLSGG